MQYKARIHNNEILLEKKDSNWMVNGLTQDWDIRRLDDKRFHMIHNHECFTAEIVSVLRAEKQVVVKINNQQYTVQLSDRFDELLKQLGMNTAAAGKINDLKSPMPGLVVKLLVQVGDRVNKGDGLLVLEAMKMENLIKASGNGTVKAIKVSAGTKVEKGELLIQFD
jgi:biotin carboxyl carrier protein